MQSLITPFRGEKAANRLAKPRDWR
ncbi:hypothetical protein RTM1035_12503 [Roseovarius sp. TM1035]|nr:hypothetical protein RTM1035_12503 [Roseovarius sp. TM1035]